MRLNNSCIGIMRFTAAVVFHRERILLMIRHSADPQTKEHTSGAGGPSFPPMSAANWRQISNPTPRLPPVTRIIRGSGLFRVSTNYGASATRARCASEAPRHSAIKISDQNDFLGLLAIVVRATNLVLRRAGRYVPLPVTGLNVNSAGRIYTARAMK